MRFVMARRAAWPAACLFALLLALAGGPGRLLAAEAPKAEPAPQAASPDRLHPRVTMETFMVSIINYRNGVDKASNLARAQACLDMSGAGLSQDLGPRYAEYLKDVIDRFWFVKSDELPDTVNGTEYTKEFYRDGKYFHLGFVKKANGEWLIAGGTLKGLDELWNQVVSWSLISTEVQATEARNVGVWVERRVPDSLKGTTFILRQWQWLGILVLIGLGVVLDRLFGFLITRLFGRWLARRNLNLDPQELSLVERPVGLAVMSIVWWAGIQWLNLPSSIYDFMVKIAVFFLAASCVWAAYRLVDVLSSYVVVLASRTKTRMDDLLIPLVRKTLKIFVVVFGLVFIAGNLGIDISTMLAGLGIGGLAFALASKDTVENLFGSFTVLLDRPFQIGDRVIILGIEGIVEEVGFRSTRLRTLNNSLVTLPNSKLVSASIENQGPKEKRRFRYVVPFKPTVPMEKAGEFRDALRQLLATKERVQRENIQIYVSEIGGAGIKLQMNVYLRAANDEAELAAREELLIEVDRLAREKAIDLA
ncbi:MAG: mechanosensitive ion channel family protein [Planctomycetota bacterium]|nr:mechanosensitive ion channel family protein [Planctomycetota bacterium]